MPFSEEDREFAQTLARQAVAALESVRLHRLSVEQQRRDREMQIAREIQQSLFPECCPAVPGFELSAKSLPCHEVGGDHYDFIPLPGGRLAVAIADVSGKGAPASILMASVHASLRTAGMSGCTSYECFGAGQHVTQVVYGGQAAWSAEVALFIASAWRAPQCPATAASNRGTAGPCVRKSDRRTWATAATSSSFMSCRP